MWQTATTSPVSKSGAHYMYVHVVMCLRGIELSLEVKVALRYNTASVKSVELSPFLWIRSVRKRYITETRARWPQQSRYATYTSIVSTNL